jgi:hypothetical protein
VATAITAPNSIAISERSPAVPRNSAASAAAFSRALSGASADGGVTFVAPVRTRLDSAQASAALRSALTNVLGEQPSEDTVRIVTAQWAHETGNGGSMFNYNFGGIKGQGPSGLSVSQRTREGSGDTERTIVDSFRAYRTAEEGATDYVHLLKARFPQALEAAKQGDPQAFVHALKQRGYFTGDEAAYTRSVASLAGMPIPASSAAPPPTLSVDRLPIAPAGFDGVYGLPPANGAAIVDGLALADEISRAALRIAASTKPRGERG